MDPVPYEKTKYIDENGDEKEALIRERLVTEVIIEDKESKQESALGSQTRTFRPELRCSDHSPERWQKDYPSQDAWCIFPCRCIFLVSCFFTGLIMIYAVANGNPQRITHGMDFRGNICGVGVTASTPYVYWCGVHAGQVGFTAIADIDLRHPICVERCPNTGVTEHECYNRATGRMHVVPDYPTFVQAGRYCFPQDPTPRQWVVEEFGQHAFQKYLFQAYTMLYKGWIVLTIVAVLSLFFLYIYVSLLQVCMTQCVRNFIWTLLIVFVFLTEILGIHMVVAAANGGEDGLRASGDGITDRILGIIVCVSGLLAIVVALPSFCGGKAVPMCIAVLHATMTFPISTYNILLEPLLNILIRTGLYIFMIWGWLWLISVGQVDTTKVYKSFAYSPGEVVMILYYLVWCIWVNEICTAVSQYVISFVAARWYFLDHKDPPEVRDIRLQSMMVNTSMVKTTLRQLGKPTGLKNIPRGLLCQAYWYAWLQSGNLCYGAFFIALLRPFRAFFAMIIYIPEVLGCGDRKAICGCWLSIYAEFLIYFSKLAYAEMAIDGAGFQEACLKVIALIQEDGCDTYIEQVEKYNKQAEKKGRPVLRFETLYRLRDHYWGEMVTPSECFGATWLFSALTCLIYGVFGGLLTHIMVRGFFPWNDPFSGHFVTDPVWCSFLAAIICMVAAFSFAIVYDTASDALILCRVHDFEDQRLHPMPKELKCEVPDNSLLPSIARTVLSTFNPEAKDFWMQEKETAGPERPCWCHLHLSTLLPSPYVVEWNNVITNADAMENYDLE
jgi:hypothetical protein